MKTFLEKLFCHVTLQREEAREALLELLSGEVSEALIGAFIAVYRMRPVTAEELLGFRDALLSVSVSLDGLPQPLIDVCGTGGDSKNTFNISTTTAFLLAACGQKVLKHGNAASTSICGSSDVLAALGIGFPKDVDDVRNELAEYGLSFLHAPLYHPAMGTIAPARKSLHVRSIFNILGPLVNPGNPKMQVCGVADLLTANLYEEVLQSLHCKYGVVYSLDGYDECSLTGKCLLKSWRGTFIFSAEDIGLETIEAKALHGGQNSTENAELLRKILQGEGALAQTAVVLANTAIALFVADAVSSLSDGVSFAKEILEKGTAGTLLDSMLEGEVS